MPISPGQNIRVTAKMNDVNGSDIQNVYFFQHQGTNDVADADFLTTVEDWMSGTYALIESLMPNTLTPTEIEADIVSFSGGVLTVIRDIGSIAWTTWTGGTGTGDGLPQGAAAVVNFPAFATTSQGRKFLGPFTEGTQNNGIWTAGAIANLVDYGARVLLDMTVDATEQFITGIMSGKDATFRGFAEAIVNAVVGYQRRRKSGVGA